MWMYSFNVFVAVFHQVDPENLTVNAVLIAMASVVGLALLLNFRTWWHVADSVLNSQRKRLHGAANNLHKLKSEGFMKVIRYPSAASHLRKTSTGNEMALNRGIYGFPTRS